MKKILLAAVFISAASFNAFGAACAATGTLASYALTGSCEVTNGANVWTLSNFGLFSASQNGYGGPPTSSNVQLSVANVSTNGFSLTYTSPGSGTNYFNSSNQDVSFLNGVWVTGTNIVQIRMDATVSSGNIGGAYESFSKEIQNQQGVLQHADLNVIFVTGGPGTDFAQTSVGSLGTNLSINDRIVFDSKTLNNGTQRSGIIDSYVNTFYAASDPGGVPEPMTFVLMGAGLVGIAALRRRKA